MNAESEAPIKLFDENYPYKKSEVRTRMGISQSTLWRQIQDGLKTTKIGGSERILGQHANEYYLRDAE